MQDTGEQTPRRLALQKHLLSYCHSKENVSTKEVAVSAFDFVVADAPVAADVVPVVAAVVLVVVAAAGVELWAVYAFGGDTWLWREIRADVGTTGSSGEEQFRRSGEGRRFPSAIRNKKVFRELRTESVFDRIYSTLTSPSQLL